jgi:hypothetical protein
MPAAAPAKPASKKSSSSSKSTARKSSAKSSHKPDPKATGVGEAIDELRDKRAEFDQPIVDTPIAVLAGGETESLEGRDSEKDADNIQIVPTGSSVELTLGGKTVTLDREGVHSLQRHLNKIAVGM